MESLNWRLSTHGHMAIVGNIFPQMTENQKQIPPLRETPQDWSPMPWIAPNSFYMKKWRCPWSLPGNQWTKNPGDVDQLPIMHKASDSRSSTMVAHSRNSSSFRGQKQEDQKVKVVLSYSEFEANLGYIRWFNKNSYMLDIMLKSCNPHLGVEGRRIRSSRPTSATCEFEAPHTVNYVRPTLNHTHNKLRPACNHRWP